MGIFYSFTLLLHVIHVVAATPVWQKIPTDTVAMSGGSTTLYCALDDLNTIMPSWYKSESTNRLQYSYGDAIDSNLCPNSCSITGDSDTGEYHMTFNPVSVQKHNGNWQCSVFLANPPTFEVRLVVLDELPTCTTDLVTKNKIISGDSVTLTCSLTRAAPPGELVWMKNNTVVLNGSQPLVWTTQITKENQNDIYNCKYHHHTLSKSPTCGDDIQFDIQYPPVIALDIAEGTHVVKIGDEFSTECTVTDANPPASVVWTNKSMEVGSGGLLRLQNTEKTDAGNYTCRATYTYYNGQQGSSSKMITIDVQYMPDSVEISNDDSGKAIENDTLTCTCSADANPTASYTWIDPAQNQIADRATLTLENVKRSNSGIYTCEASNLLGKAKATVYVDVQYPPIASVSISSGDRAGTIREGEYFSAACVAVDGNPPPTVEWIKDGVLVAAGSSLSLLNINKLYSGVYKCTATSTYYNNYTSTDEKVITLDVQYPPGPPHVHYFNDGKVIEGTTFNATCTGRNGNPSSYTYQWRHGDQSITDQQILKVEKIQRDQSGLYTCITTNDMYDMTGSATGTIAIDVQYLPTKVGDTRYFAEIGHSVVIKLTVDANPLPVTFGEWKLGHVALNKTDSFNTSSVTITDVQPEHFGNYNVSAENAVGVATIIVSLEPTGPPGAPTLQLLSQDYRNLTLLINPGHSGGDEGGVVYTLEYRVFGFGPFNPWQSSTTSVVIVVFDLQSGSVYEFQAYAENSFGKSDISDTYKFNTYGLPNITLNLDTRTLSWTPHDNENYYNCVKIEKKTSDKDAEWEIIEECIPQPMMEYTVSDKNAEYRISYCTVGGICEDSVFHPVVQYSEESKGNISGILAGTLTSLCILLIILAAIIVLVRIRSRRNTTVRKETEIDLSSNFNKDGVGQRIYEVIDVEESANVTVKNTTKKAEAASPYEVLNPKMISESVYMKCGETSFEYPRDRLSTRSVLHDGNRHRIVLCKAWHIGGKEGASEVAVKMATGKAKAKEESDIVNESILMRKIPIHPNIVKLLGVCTHQGPTYIIMEYLFQGSLETCLQEIRSSSARDQSVTERELLSFASDIGSGMEHLANLKIVHRFLSSKHVLVDDSLRCKISNFGYASEVIDDQSFYEKAKVSCPERWMAMESFSMTFTEKSDVWSFGVVLWQIATLGDTPYESLNANKMERKLKSGLRLQKPGSCGQFAYDQMTLCWQKEPRDRPSFSKLVKNLNTLKNKEKEFMDISALKESTYAVIK